MAAAAAAAETAPRDFSRAGPLQRVLNGSSGSTFTVGQSVMIRGLRNAAEHNGREGDVQSFDSQTGRYIVKLRGSALGSIAVRPDNLLSAATVTVTTTTAAAAAPAPAATLTRDGREGRPLAATPERSERVPLKPNIAPATPAGARAMVNTGTPAHRGYGNAERNAELERELEMEMRRQEMPGADNAADGAPQIPEGQGKPRAEQRIGVSTPRRQRCRRLGVFFLGGLVVVTVLGVWNFNRSHASCRAAVPNGTCTSCEVDGGCDAIVCTPGHADVDRLASTGCEVTCPSGLPGVAVCTWCTEVGRCTALRCRANRFDSDGDVSNGCEAGCAVAPNTATAADACTSDSVSGIAPGVLPPMSSRVMT
jgi:hypothetical protein